MDTMLSFLAPRRSRTGPRDHEIVREIADHAAKTRPLADRELRALTEGLKKAVHAGLACTSRDILVPAFACIEEAVRRTIGVTLFDVQLLAGLVLCRGAVAQMQTGEGKTLAASLPALLGALTGKPVHIVTPNSYLALRDYQLLAPAWRLLGLEAGLVTEQGSHEEKRAAYACDITYGTGYEFGFDYLRDQLQCLEWSYRPLGERHRDLVRGLARSGPDKLQRGHALAVIDEIDSVLIDEARLPLVLADPPRAESGSAAACLEALRTVELLRTPGDYTIDESARGVTLTSAGMLAIHDIGDRAGLALQRPWSVYVRQALEARLFLEKDVDYIVQRGRILLVDEFTGRVFAERSWQAGLQQAIEAKERLSISAERRTAAGLSRQRYFRLYETMCGMTATAAGSQRELASLYRLPVVLIPLANPCRRTVLATRYFTDVESKWQAVVRDVERVHATGRPLLVGSRTIENSQLLAERLCRAGIAYRLLNGKQDEEEADIVALAGRRSAVTIATNMAGRGTDIKLAPGVDRLGGLHVIGVERHESQRIDLQLGGRAGRQGDPGSCQFFVSADDPLIRRFAPALGRRMQTMANCQGEIRADLSAQIAALQVKVAAANYAQRRRLLAYDRWLDQVVARLLKAD